MAPFWPLAGAIGGREPATRSFGPPRWPAWSAPGAGRAAVPGGPGRVA